MILWSIIHKASLNQSDMKITTLRRLDSLIGLPLCVLLTAVQHIGSFFKKQKETEISKILFVKLAEQGSTVLAADALDFAASLVGKQNLYFLAFEENRFIVDAMELVPPENVIVIAHKSAFSLLASGVKALAKMWSSKIDCAVDLEFFSRGSAAASYLSGAKRRAGFHSYSGEGPYRGNLLSHRVIYNPYLHTSQSFLSLVKALAAPSAALPAFPEQIKPASPLNKSYSPPPEEIQHIRSLLRKKNGGKEPGPLLLLNANCSDMLPLRRWPSERYVELGKRILQCYPEAVIGLTGTAEELPPLKKLAEDIGSSRCLIFAGETTLPGLLALYSLSEILITNDSGPAHFACLTPIDVVAIFGPETPRLFGSLSPRSHTLWSGIACSPCVSAFNNRYSKCKNNLCMQLISVDHVFEQVCEVYALRRKDGRMARAADSLH